MQRISDQNLTRLSPKIISENAVKSILADIIHFARALKYLICRFIKSLPAVKHSFPVIHRIFQGHYLSQNQPRRLLHTTLTSSP